MVSKDESDFAKRRSFKTGLKNTNRKTDGSTKCFAAKKNVKKKWKKWSDVNEAIDWMVQMFFWWLNSFLPRSPDSENTATTVTALLASLNSCCNPWIYMFFSGHLLQDCIQSFPCCQQIKQTLSKEDSNSNSRRQTSFTNNRSPTHSLNTWREMSHSKVTSFIPIPTWDTQDLQSHHSVWEGCGMVLYASPGHHGTKEWLRWSWDKKCHLAW